ncbi:hypothetical protein ACWGB8_31685 [Kitasatospora sp. NPDC054939]
MRDLNAINAGAPTARSQNTTAPRLLATRTSFVVSLIPALLLGALALLVLLPADRHLRSLQGDRQAEATLRTSGSCMLGACRVAFTADGRTGVTDLPFGSSGGKSTEGAHFTVRYRADDPQTAAREDDVEGDGATVMALLAGTGALLLLATAASAAVTMARPRRAADGVPH